MDLYFESLAWLEARDTAALFSQETQARADRVLIQTQVALRLAQEADYSLTAYRYTIRCSRIQKADGRVELLATEDSVQNFAQHPEIDSQRCGVYHLFTLEQTQAGWKLAGHMQVDALYLQLWREERAGAEAYIEEAPAYLRDLLDSQEARLAQRGQAGDVPTADHPYDRAAALDYAGQYALRRNGDWPDYSGSGGNCQNFASQVLLAGGIPMDRSGSAVWKWYDRQLSSDGSRTGRSSSWASVSAFLSYARSNTGYGLAAQVDAPYYTGQPGDLIQMGTQDAWRHTVVISGLVLDGAGEVIDYLVHSNTKDMRDYPASLYGYSRFCLTRIIGWNEG